MQSFHLAVFFHGNKKLAPNLIVHGQRTKPAEKLNETYHIYGMMGQTIVTFVKNAEKEQDN